MDALQSRPLLVLRLDVGFDAMLDVGTGVHGRRRIVPIRGGSFEGERLSGTVLPGGADWVINRPDGAMAIDVRIALRTADAAIIYLTYQGLFRAEADAMKRFNRGGQLTREEYTLRTTARFETGAAGYAWLNDMIAIGVGEQTAAGPIYTLHEIL